MSSRKPRTYRGNDLILGTDEGGESIVMPHEARRGHTHIEGRTHSGKSRFMNGLIRQDIMNWHKTHSGLLLTDPDGELCNAVTASLAKEKAHPPKRNESAKQSTRGKKGRRHG